MNDSEINKTDKNNNNSDIFSDLNKLNIDSKNTDQQYSKFKKKTDKIKDKIKSLPIKISLKKQKKWFNSIDIKNVNVHIDATFNNTKIILTTAKGSIIQDVTAGMLGQNNTKRGRMFSAKKTAETMIDVLSIFGINNINKIYTTGENRNNKVFALATILEGIGKDNVNEIIDITPKKFNGVRLPRRRRV